MYWIAAPAKKISGEMKSDDTAATVLIRSATSDSTFDDKKNVIGGVSLTDDHCIAAITDRTSPKRENVVLYDLLIAITQKHW